METYTTRLGDRVRRIGSRLCVGLDPRPDQIRGETSDFLYRVIEECAEFAAAFKPNIAYFEAMGPEGLRLLEEVRRWIPDDVPLVLDAKRSDIGETQKYYARAVFDRFGADAVTLNPWLGQDTVEPFLEHSGKGLYLLCITSNPGAVDIALRRVGDEYLFETVTAMCGPPDVGLVTGLTNLGPDVLDRIPDVPLLVPGLGAQGGDLAALAGGGRKAPVLINVSRGILFRDPDRSFGEKAQAWRDRIQKELM